MVYKEVQPSELVKGTEYYFSTDRNFIVSGRFLCTRIQIDGNDFNHLLFYPIKGNTKKRYRMPDAWLFQFYKNFWIIDNTKIKIYLKITRKDYKEKLREKYQQTALKIILKRIVNEDFEWN
jgi:hypothetical protein